MKKFVIMGSQARAMLNFWSVFIRDLLLLQQEVFCFVPAPEIQADIKAIQSLEKLGAKVVTYPLNRKGLNPLDDFATMLELKRLFKQYQPDLLFVYTIKPVIYGLWAARLAKIPKTYAMITGLGYTFEADTPLKKILSWGVSKLYSFALGGANGIFFQNTDDLKTFKHKKALPTTVPVYFSKGTGVDLNYFKSCEAKLSPLNFLFIGRLLEAKGLYELIEAIKLIKEKHPEVSFSVLGPEEKARGGVPGYLVADWVKSGYINYHGACSDVRPYIQEAGVLVLPSYREGMPCAVLEAMAMSRPAIVTDVPGCRDVIKDKETGLVVPVKDAKALALAMEYFIKQPEEIKRMGLEARKIVEKEFSAELVNKNLMLTMGIR